MAPRVMPENRIPDIIKAAVKVFSFKGYRLARLEEIAKEAKVSKAGLYYYFRSKAQLFNYIIEQGVPEENSSLSPPESSSALTDQELLDLLKKRFEKDCHLESIERALAKSKNEIDAADEFSEIVEELWEFFESHRVQIKILDNSVLDFPELASVYDKYGRERIIKQLEQYLENRAQLGAIRPLTSITTVSRAMIEAIAWFGFKQSRNPIDPPRNPRSEVLPELIAIFSNGVKKM